MTALREQFIRELTIRGRAERTIHAYVARLAALVQHYGRSPDRIAAQVPRWSRYPFVKALINLRGFQLTVATVIVAEIGDIRRFKHPRHLMAFLGLVPGEESTGESRRLGAITKAGNGHARWMLIKTVQCALNRTKVSPELTTRQSGQPADRRDLAWKAQNRLHKRGWHLLNRGLLKPKITVALAREMAAFVWAMLHLVPAPTAGGTGLRRT